MEWHNPCGLVVMKEHYEQGGEYTETFDVVKFDFGSLVDGITVRFGAAELTSLPGALGRFNTWFWNCCIFLLSAHISER